MSVMALGFFKKLFAGGSGMALGVDIGTTSIKVAELALENGAATLVNYGSLEALGYLERENTALQSSSLKIFEQEVVRYLAGLIAKTGIRTRTAVASLPAFAVFSTVLDIPPMPDAEVSQALQFKARQYIPLPISSVSLDWVRVAPQKVLLLAIPNDLIAKYKSIFSAAGLELAALEVEGVSMARALTKALPPVPGQANDADGPVLMIDIGSRSTGIFVAEGGLLQLAGQTDIAGAALTHGVSTGLGIAIRRAEDLKRERGLVSAGFGVDQELSTLLLPLVDGILQEAKRLAERYSSSYGKKVSRVVLAGSGANMPGLSEYAAKELSLPAEKANPFMHVIHSPSAEPFLIPLGPALSVAVGAALKLGDS